MGLCNVEYNDVFTKPKYQMVTYKKEKDSKVKWIRIEREVYAKA